MLNLVQKSKPCAPATTGDATPGIQVINHNVFPNLALNNDDLRLIKSYCKCKEQLSSSANAEAEILESPLFHYLMFSLRDAAANVTAES